ncbi:GNAT family N-acetyltransferase [Pseudooceanicola algae]|uniref:Putative N-acetyltransferase YsnE n=1 Tax=Pseudooceanicola algae TaxID=1537215 RepID=A0A418SDD2_9RHOB|nr:GNAT family N-acetyltransferase [Pseudooceanicola algae]QPM91046.1 putative N-acetyltransferase YsnE [Pseudooceanicola algae]
MITVTPAAATDPEAVRLLDASQALMKQLYKPEENNFLSHAALSRPDIRFFLARSGDEVLGCGALQIKSGYGEIKSFYTDEAARGRGVGSALLTRIEDEARANALPILRLETGDALAAACRLYEARGYARCGAFGDYADNGVSVFMEKTLPPAQADAG